MAKEILENSSKGAKHNDCLNRLPLNSNKSALSGIDYIKYITNISSKYI